MPRLFLKLFGSFWVTTVVVLAVSIWLSFYVAEDEIARQVPDPRETDDLIREVLESKDIEGLRQWIEEGEVFPPGQTVYMVNEDGEEILAREVPEWLQERVRRMWSIDRRGNTGGRMGSRRDRSSRDFTAVIEVNDGTRWVSIPGPTAAPTFGVLSRADTRWLILILAALISLISFWFLSRSLARPAHSISSAVARFASGDFSARVGSGGYSNDEIGEVGRQFDVMAEQLETQANLRRELFRNISHELRAPLARLQIAVELIERNPDQTAGYVDRIQQEVAVLQYLTGQVISLAKVSQDPAASGESDVSSVMARVMEDARFEGGQKGVTIEYNPPDVELTIALEESIVISAVENVVRNAIQATPEGGVVRVDCRPEAERCVFVVSDTGPGIPDSELEKIFEPFHRLDTNQPGSGIGLAITSRVATLIGGSVEAQNRKTGGLQVTISLPAREVQ